MRSADWLPIEVAVARVLAAVTPLQPERVPLQAALGRVLAERVSSPIDQPPWDNSAMDGFAVRSGDVASASAAHPVTLRVIESIAAGAFPACALGPGEAARIMTGAPVPEGADGVIRVEHTRPGGKDEVLVFDNSDAGRNIRFRGEDVASGATVLEPGRRLRAAEIGVLAMVGHAQVTVHRTPRVAILSTGDELAPLEDFEPVLAGRRIVDSNSQALAAAVRATGGEPLLLGIARDDADSLRARLGAALDADLLLTTAGASVGDHDIVKDVLADLGFVLDFWRVTMRPGSPVSFGMLPRNGGRTPLPVFGLPGNPVSALVTWELLARPAVRRLAGRAQVHNPTHSATLEQDVPSTPRLTHFLRVRLRTADDGGTTARLTGAQGSGIASSMAEADALLIVPVGRDSMAAGETARVMPLPHADVAVDTLDI